MNEALVSVLVEKLKQKEAIEKEIAEIKVLLEPTLPSTGYKNDLITISHKNGTQSTSIDLDKLKENEPDLYNDLIKDYPKTKITKPSISYSLKKPKKE